MKSRGPKLEPFSRVWGFDRGRPIDRYYIESFLAANQRFIRGRALEVANDHYTRRFGRGVLESDVLNVAAGDSRTTIVADLAVGEGIPSAAFDCFICTQTLHLIYEVRAAAETIHRLLKPGGVALVTVPGISQISRADMDRWGDFWRFSSASAGRLFTGAFPGGKVEVESHGNLAASIAFLYGLAAEEVRAETLDVHDPDYELLLTVLAFRG